MAGKEVITNNEKLRKVLATFDNYHKDLTTEAKDLIYQTIKDAMPGSKKGYSSEKVYYLIYHVNEISRASIKYWCDQWSGIHLGEPIMGVSSVRKYKDVCKAVADALLEANRQGIKLIKSKEEDKDYLTDYQQFNVMALIQNGTAIQDVIMHLQGLIQENHSDNTNE
ncbi:hypothetical protein ERHA55_29480 [Erwinia rhapontici]|uniref:Phage protein n=1 Tax=Erwinia rhapontici TaxID=55212 RepID=A0ABM7N1R5_ERWRD|nr:hypothetical protein [Erwinia rhapontici]BCQ35277.1 hypothetical protein ERHA53_26200 [Erwinia rhapontici]BCQ45421.1 hypothetical protein ERHA55_29480 [Erwinia rhapontici]